MQELQTRVPLVAHPAASSLKAPLGCPCDSPDCWVNLEE